MYEELASSLFSSSTKRRIASLDHIRNQIEAGDVDTLKLRTLSSILFDTYPLYIDRSSRRALERCWRAILQSKDAESVLTGFLPSLQAETSRRSLAPANCFVLTELCCLLLTEFAAQRTLWNKWGLDILKDLAEAFEACLASSTRRSVKQSAIVVARRALRTALRGIVLGKSGLESIISTLTQKGPSPTAKYAPLLGVVAGVSARIPPAKQVFRQKRQDCYSFYIREIIGSRTRLPPHIGNGLHDLFLSFATLEDIQRDIMPGVEKALLRAPEVVLNDLVSPLISSLSTDLDLSLVLHKSLLNPLLSSVKSTNATIRAGALKTFEAAAKKSTDEPVVAKIAAEIGTPLKQSKVPSTDHKILHAQMLSALNSSAPVVTTIISSLTSAASKETNEMALDAEVSALCTHQGWGLARGMAIDTAAVTAFEKGLMDKRQSARRIWALRAGSMLWDLADKHTDKPAISTLRYAVLKAMLYSFNDVVANPLPAAQNGLATVAYVFVALFLTQSLPEGEKKVQSLTPKTTLLKTIFATGDKPSFLLNSRVYSKISGQDDLSWLTRALAAIPESFHSSSQNVLDAWSQAILYLICAAGVSYQVKQTTSRTLSKLYVQNPSAIAKIIVGGTWAWRQRVDTHEKDSAALLAKTQTSQLSRVFRSICLTPKEAETFGTVLDEEVLKTQMVHLLVLARAPLIPNISWIDLCLRAGVDPGELVKDNSDKCMKLLIDVSENYSGDDAEKVNLAVHRAAADLAFVAPDVAIPLIVAQIQSDLDPKHLAGVGSTEAAIFRTPEGTTYIDVLANKPATQISKSAKDYDVLKWEEELRAQIAKKSNQTKKLTADEQAKVKAQVQKESEIRAQLRKVHAKLTRGVGIIRALTNGPPTEAELWIVQAVTALQEVIEAGAGLLAGDNAALAFLDCSSSVASRLGPLRLFLGVAILRTMGVTQLKSEWLEEPLQELVTRVLYRLRFVAEHMPFDPVSLAYMLPLIFQVLENGGYAKKGSEESDEQLVLALEFLSLHSDVCANERLPRKRLLENLVTSMQKYAQHYKLIKDCLHSFVHHLEPTIIDDEIDVLLAGAVVPEVSVRTAVLQAIDMELDLSSRNYCEEIWIASHDVVKENAELAENIWSESELQDPPEAAMNMLERLKSPDKQLRRAVASAIADTVTRNPAVFPNLVSELKSMYHENALPKAPEKDEFGMARRKEIKDNWEERSGIALTLKSLAPIFQERELVDFVRFLDESGPLGDRNDAVRDEIIDAGIAIISAVGGKKVEELMKLLENVLDGPDRGLETNDKVNEAAIILYGSMARHLKAGDRRVPVIVQRLLVALSTPSETVQYAVADCLPPLVRASAEMVPDYVQQMMDELLKSKKYASRRGAAYGLAGIVRGKGIVALREFRVMATLKAAAEAKKDQNQRQGAFIAYEVLSHMLGRLFEPYVINIIPQLLAGFGDSSADVREACLDAAKACFTVLSSYGVGQILPTFLEGLDEDQWRSKKGACDSLGAMAYLDADQLALRLPEIIPPLSTVLNDSHKEVRASANRSLQRFGEVISNPEIKSVVSTILKALSDPTKFTDEALDSLIRVQFVHYLDAPSLALVVRVLERGLGDRSATKRKASQIIGSLAHLTEKRDLTRHLPILVSGLRLAIVDPVPTTRATASKALGSMIEKLGEDAMPDLIPSLMSTLKADSGAADRLGSAQALSEVLAGLGTARLEETLPSILQNASSTKPSVREGFMSLFIFLPACFGNSFSNYLSKIIPPILTGLADDVDSIRETALRAGRLLVKNFASRAIDLLLPELERGLADDNHRIRLSSVELVGDLLFNLTGISAKAEDEEEEPMQAEAGQSLLEVLGEERRNRVLSAIYICRCDTSGLVRSASINVWKALVPTPRTLREIIPTLSQLIIRRLASSSMEQKVIAGNALAELIRKAGEGILASLLPTLEEGLHSTDTESKQGICIALRELISAASPDALEEYEDTLILVVRTALVDSNSDVREAAAEAFDSLQKILGKKAVDQVLPHLLSLLRSEDAQNALSALLTLLNDNTRSNIILPNLLPTLLISPISAFNAKALASLAEVAGSAMYRRLPTVINALADNIVGCKNPELLDELESAFDSVLLSAEDPDALTTIMGVMLSLVKHDDHRRRRVADAHLAKFFADAEVDISRYHAELIRALLIAFDDSDKEVVKAAWTALTALTKRLRKDEMENLVISTRQIVREVGVPGSNLAGFELPKGINAILPIFLQGLINGTPEQRTQAALAIADVVDRTSAESLKPSVTQITGPLIRVVSERSVEVKAAILFTLNNLLEKIPAFLKPFLPQLQRTFAKSLADTSSELLRVRAAKALGTLITLTPRVDPLIAELVTGSKTPDPGVKSAMLKALYEVVTKAGANMSDASRQSILGLIDNDLDEQDDTTVIAHAKLLGALVMVLPPDIAAGLIRSRVLCTPPTKSSMLALNAVLVESPSSLATTPFHEESLQVLATGLKDTSPPIHENAILATGKFLLTPSHASLPPPRTALLLHPLAALLPPGHPPDARRLALVVLRTVSRHSLDTLITPHLPVLAPAVFACVRDPVVPVKLAAEAAFLELFNAVEEQEGGGKRFERFVEKNVPEGQRRGWREYWKRVAGRLGGVLRERRGVEGVGEEGEDEREVWAVGREVVES